MHVGALWFDLRLRDVRSLKQKRAVIRPILDGCRRRYQVAAAEVDHQDRWQRAGLCVSAVAGSAGHAAAVLEAVERFVWSFPDVEVVEVRRGWMEWDER